MPMADETKVELGAEEFKSDEVGDAIKLLGYFTVYLERTGLALVNEKNNSNRLFECTSV